jgi:hypothetical protein
MLLGIQWNENVSKIVKDVTDKIANLPRNPNFNAAAAKIVPEADAQLQSMAEEKKRFRRNP